MALRDTIWHQYLRRPYRLAVREAGDGEPLVLLHGLGGSGEVWAPLISKLPPGKWHAIMPDLLGFGDSPRPGWSKYSVRDHARAIITTLNKHHIGQPVTIVAHSMGCLIAAHLATRYPRRVKRLVLYAPPLFADEPVFPRHTKMRQRYFAFFEYVAAHPQLILLQKRRLWRLAKKMIGVDMSEEKWLPFERSLRNTIMAQQAYSEMLKLSVPTDIVYGRLDIVVTRTEVNKMLESNKHIAMHLVTGTHNVTKIPAAYLAKLLDAKERGE